VSPAIIDDQLVLALILGDLVPADGELVTTYTWWWRLGTAIRRRRGGSLSGPTLRLSDVERAALVDTVDALPTRIRVPDPRALYPVAADIASEHGLNLLSAEATAAAVVLDAEIVVGIDNPGVRRAAAALRVTYRVR
jgi:hypothetical protein